MLEEIDVLGLDVKTFGLFFALNFAAWGAIVAVRLRELGKPADWAWEMVFVALGGGYLGARLYYLVQNGFEDDLLSSLFSGSGLIWYGGLLGGAIAVVAWARWRGFLGLQLLDIAAIGLPIGYAIGRIGCQISGDGDYGGPTDLPWAMPFPDGVVPTDEDVHPSPLYETISMGTLGLVLWHLRDRVRPGGLFALYLVAAGLERFLIEFVRRNDAVLAGLTAAQIESALLFAVGVGLVIWFVRRGGLLVSPGRSAPRSATA